MPFLPFHKTTLLPAALLLAIMACCGIATPARAQTELMSSVQQRFSQQANRVLLEKLYAHTDRSLYLAGESMWFKLYVVDGSRHTLLDLSKVAYVELLNIENKPVLQAKIALEEGSGNGSFYLPLSLTSGTYKLRAYTSWMKNFGPEFYFEKEISLVNTYVAPQVSYPQGGLAPIDVQFFPEGGDLVVGIRSKVAFKSVDSSGKGRHIQGAVRNSRGDTVALLNPLRFGMGHFYLQPEEGMAYTAIVQTTGGTPALTVALPAVAQRGYGMLVEEGQSGELSIQAASTFNDQRLHLFVHTRQQVKVVASETIQNGKAVFKINSQQLGEGISHITLFNQNRQPVAERLWFVHPKNSLRIEAEADKAVYASREKVEIRLSTHGKSGEFLASDLSMAVYRIDSLQQEDKENILSNLWLTSDLVGHIETPLYYFENTGPLVKEALDNLLLTQGWRRFRWEDVLDEKAPAFSHLLEYEGHILKAMVHTISSGAPQPGIVASLSAPGKLLQFHTSKSNKQGELLFVTNKLFGQNHILIQNTSFQRDSIGFSLAGPYSEHLTPPVTKVLELKESNKELLRLRHIHMQAQNLYWEKELNHLIPPVLDSTAFFGLPDKTYLLDNYTRFPTMEEVMREYVYEVRVRKSGGNYTFRVAKPTRDGFYSEAPLVLLDGKPVFTADNIIAYNPLKIEKLDILQERFILGGNMIFDGIISYTSYKGEAEDLPAGENLVQMLYDGLHLQREFYSPAYEAGHTASVRTPDFRELLYWAPAIRTAGAKENLLRFYTSDLKGKFMVVIQGVSQNGNPGTKTFYIDVKENPF
jgi:hypothetical protein